MTEEEVKKLEKEQTQKLLRVLDTEGARYVYRDGYVFNSTPVPGVGEFERRITAEPITDAHMQVLRYIISLGYSEETHILAEAEATRASGALKNVITDRKDIHNRVVRLRQLGMITRRAYIDIEAAKKDGIGSRGEGEKSPDGTIACYHVTERGMTYFKNFCESTAFIEGTLISKPPIEILRRLSTNYIVQALREQMLASAPEAVVKTSHTRRLAHGERSVVYGSLETDSDVVFFEPVFFERNMKVQTEEEQDAYLAERARLLNEYFDDAANADGKTRRKILVLVGRDVASLKKAFFTYGDLTNMMDAVYITSELVVRYATSDTGRQIGLPAMLLAYRNAKDDTRMSCRAVWPTFLRK